MKGENGTPETPDWTPDRPRRCVLDCVCESDQQHLWLVGDHIVLGEN